LIRDDSLSFFEHSKLTDIRIIIATNGLVIDPVDDDLKLFIPKMNNIPEICPASNRKPLEVPSETG
jgi:hypothetical protein